MKIVFEKPQNDVSRCLEKIRKCLPTNFVPDNDLESTVDGGKIIKQRLQKKEPENNTQK